MFDEHWKFNYDSMRKIQIWFKIEKVIWIHSVHQLPALLPKYTIYRVIYLLWVYKQIFLCQMLYPKIEALHENFPFFFLPFFLPPLVWPKKTIFLRSVDETASFSRPSVTKGLATIGMMFTSGSGSPPGISSLFFLFLIGFCLFVYLSSRDLLC